MQNTLAVKLFIILSFIFSAKLVFAQSSKISGRVTDAENNSPVVGASVIIEESKKGASTDVE